MKDIHYTSDYFSVFEKTYGYEAELFFYGDKDIYIIYPYFKRIVDLSFFSTILGNSTEQLYDIVGPWFFGGSLIKGSREIQNIFNRFKNEFYTYCLNNNIISEFVRFHPFFENHYMMDERSIVKSNPIIYVNLQEGEENIWKNLKKSNRKNIRRARNRGVEVYITDKKRDWDSFYKLYNDAMHRKKANKLYIYPKEFYINLYNFMKNNITLFVAKTGSEIIAASLMLHGYDIAHDYLRASNPNYSNLYPNNLLIYEKIIWAKKQGYKIYNLMGGGGNPNQLRFKLSFSQSTKNTYLYKKIYNKKTYLKICEMVGLDKNKLEFENASFFPEYRKGE